MGGLYIQPEEGVIIEAAAVRRENIYDTAQEMLSLLTAGRPWAWGANEGQRFRRQLNRKECKIGEFTGGFRDAYSIAVLQVMCEIERQQLRLVDFEPASVLQWKLGYPVVFIAPYGPRFPPRPGVEDESRRTLYSMVFRVLRYLEDLKVCERRSNHLTVEYMLEQLEGIESDQWPTSQQVGKYLCIVAELDRAYSQDTMELVYRFIRALERIFIEGGKGDVFYFFDQRWNVGPVLKSYSSLM